MQAPAKPVKVMMRHGECRCGCNGTDPWHAKHLTRKILNFTPVADGRTIGRLRVVASGQIKHPCGELVDVEAYDFISTRSLDGYVFWMKAGI